MAGLEDRTAARCLRWLTGLVIPPENIEKHLQRCLGCWAAETLKGVPRGQPGDRPLRRLLSLEAFDVSDYRGDPLLALATHAALHARDFEHKSLTGLVAVYAGAVNSFDSDRAGDLGLVRALLQRAGLDASAAAGDAVSNGDGRMPEIGDRDQLLNLCSTVAVLSVWGSREVDIGDLSHLLPPLAVSYAMDWDLEVVCALLRTCAYLGLAEQPACRWAKEWLIDQHSDGRFGLILQECRLLGRDPAESALFFLPTVRALWTLAELRHPGFLLGPTDNCYRLDAQRQVDQQIAVGAEQVPILARTRADDAAADVHEIGPLKMHLRPVSESRLQRHGLEPGTPAPTFHLVDLFGRGDVSLNDYRGKRVLLVFTDPDCGPCDEVTAQLVAFDKQRPSDGPQILMVSRGDPDANQRKLAAHDIAFPVVLQDRWALSKLYGIFAFPVAFLIDEEGAITHNVARGPKIATLLTASSRSPITAVSSERS